MGVVLLVYLTVLVIRLMNTWDRRSGSVVRTVSIESGATVICAFAFDVVCCVDCRAVFRTEFRVVDFRFNFT